MNDNWSLREFVIGRKSPGEPTEYVLSYLFDTCAPLEMTEDFSAAYGFDNPFDAGKAMSIMAQCDTDASWYVFKRTVVKEKIIGMEVRSNESNC